MFTRFGLTLDANGTVDWLCDLCGAAQDFCASGITRRMSYEERYHALQQGAGIDWYQSPNHALVDWIASGYDPRDAWLCGYAGCLRSTSLVANFGREVSYEEVRDALYAAWESYYAGRAPWLREGDLPSPVRNGNAISTLEPFKEEDQEEDGDTCDPT